MRFLNSFFAVFTFFISSTFAQQSSQPTWKFTQYDADILKVTFLPGNYLSGENISDAVILKPLQKVTMSTTINGNTVVVSSMNKTVAISSLQSELHKGFSIEMSSDEKIYGGGERALPLNRRGYKFNLYNSPHYGYSEGAENLNYSVPFFTSSNGYGLFFDNASKGYADIGKNLSDRFEVGFVSGEINVYIIFGKDYKEILSNFHKLTGKQPLPPRWAMGNLMSRFGYTSESQTKDILSKMKKEKIPVDAIIFDLFWFGDSIQNTLGNLAWINKTKWPNPARMIRDFKKDNINTVLITEPFVVKTSLNYKNTIPYQAVDSSGKNPFVLTNFYFGKGGLIDIFKNDAQKWFWSKYKEQMNIGVEGWWGDLGEPETHPSDMYHNLKDLGYKRLFKADEIHNIYGHEWTKMLFNRYAKEYPTKRLFSLNRSGFAGTQRYGIFPWSGDVSRSWSGLRAQLPVMLGMSMSGVPYVHADAGGFAGGDGDNELYVRWLQFAAFTPIFRPHGTALDDVDKNAFSFPSEAALIQEPYRTYAKNAIKARYALLPYNYTLAYKQATKGEPLVAPLYYYYPSDTTAATIIDEFMWGENILVAPILEKGVKEKTVYLPKGKWYKLNSDSILDFNVYQNKVEQAVTITDIPVFVKAGSFIPTIVKSNGENTKSQTTDTLVVHYFLDLQKSSYTMFDDDGVTKQSIANKSYELITFSAEPIKNSIKFSVKSNGGNFVGKPKKRVIMFAIHSLKKTDSKFLGVDLFTLEFKGTPVTIKKVFK